MRGSRGVRSATIGRRASNLVAPQSEAEYRNLVFAGEFAFLTDLLCAGRLSQFESHGFMKRVTEHALLDVPAPNSSAIASLDAGALRLAISGSWPNDGRVNAVSWALSSSNGTNHQDVIQRRSSSDRFNADIRIPVTPLLDVQVVFGILTKSGVFIGSPSQFRSREEFTYEPVAEIEPTVDQPVILKEFSLQMKKSWLPWIPRAVGVLGIATTAIILIVRL